MIKGLNDKQVCCAGFIQYIRAPKHQILTFFQLKKKKKKTKTEKQNKTKQKQKNKRLSVSLYLAQRTVIKAVEHYTH